MEDTSLETRLKELDYTKSTLFCKAFGEEGSDKGNVNLSTSWHNYSVVYHLLFDAARNPKGTKSVAEDKEKQKDQQNEEENLVIFEMGIGSVNPSVPSNMKHQKRYRPGASLRAWKTLFPSASVIGADIDKTCLYQSEDISTYYCDQCDEKSIAELWNENKLKDVQINIFVDDGLHTFEANRTLFLASFHKIAKGGTYVIEDINIIDKLKWISQVQEWEKDERFKEFSFLVFDVPSKHNGWDNRLLIVQRSK